MAALKIGHFNTALLAKLVRLLDELNLVEITVEILKELLAPGLKDLLDESHENVAHLCARINDAPYDVICLNEVFDEPSRQKFIELLKDKFPHRVEKVSGGSITDFQWDNDGIASNFKQFLAPVLDDSGLMLFSRFPLIEFKLSPRGGKAKFAYTRYKHAAGWDGLAPKCGAAVAVDVPNLSRFVISFTHLQADYSGEHYPEVRKTQLGQWFRVMQDVGKATGATHVVACGDINVDGAVQKVVNGKPVFSENGEYENLFKNGLLFNRLRDDWLLSHHVGDRFITHPGSEERLDYIMTGLLDGDPGTVNQDRLMVPHHLMLARNLWHGTEPENLIATPFSMPKLPARGGSLSLSDHFGVNAVINHFSPGCNPSQAVEAVIDKNKFVFKDVFRLEDEGAYQWYRINTEGTCYIKPVNGLGFEVRLFNHKDLSVGIPPINSSGWSDEKIRLRGDRYSLPEAPTFVRIRDPNEKIVKSPVQFQVIMARGQTRDDAIMLDGWRSDTKDFKNAQFKKDDERWFEARLNETTTGKQQQIQVIVSWDPELWTQSKPPFELRVENAAGQLLGKTDCKNSNGSKLLVKSAGGIELYPVVHRHAADAPPFNIEWRSDITILHGPGSGEDGIPGAAPTQLKCTDETGSDWAGSDEIRLRIRIDGLVERERVWKDAEAFDSDPDTVRDIGGLLPVSFQNKLEFHLTEIEDVMNDEAGNAVEQGLKGNAKQLFGKEVHIQVDDGDYKLKYNLSRWLPRYPK